MKPLLLIVIPLVVGVVGAIVTNPGSAAQSQAQQGAQPAVVAQR